MLWKAWYLHLFEEETLCDIMRVTFDQLCLINVLIYVFFIPHSPNI